LYKLFDKYNMSSWIKNFGIKIWQKIEDQLANYIACLIIAIFAILFFVLKEWFLKVRAIAMYNLFWFLLCVFFITLVIYFLSSAVFQRNTVACHLQPIVSGILACRL